MSCNLNERTRKSLLLMAHRSLKKGELVILAKVLADKIPVVTQSDSEVMGATLKYRNNINNVLYCLNEYTHIPVKEVESVCAMVDDFWSWRRSVATGTSMMLFSGDPNTVIDDMTGIMTYAKSSDLCSVSDVVKDANYICSLFKDVVNSTWG